MKQLDLNRPVARVTGESVGRIARLGFSLLRLPRPPARTRPTAGDRQGHCVPAMTFSGRRQHA